MTQSEEERLATLLYNRGYSDVEVEEILECIAIIAEERP